MPWLVTIHATEYGRHQGWVKKRPQSRIHAAERRMARGADHVITCSDYMAGHVAQVFGVGVAADHGDPNGIDPADLVAASGARSWYRCGPPTPTPRSASC